MMKQRALISFTLLLISLICASSTAFAQSPSQAPSQDQDHKAHAPAAQAPEVHASPRKSPLPATPNVTDILEKAGGFNDFIRLLKNTQVINQIETQLNNSNNAMTIFAPTNDAFSGLKPGTLNSLDNEQRVQLLQFHLLPSFESLSNFQTISNPVRTQSSNTRDYPLNITTTGGAVNISTGLVNTSISGTVYSDNQVAIYRVEKVLLPLALFAPPVSPSPSPAPSPSPLKSPSPSTRSPRSPTLEKPKKDDPTAAANNSSSSSTNNIPPVGSLDLSAAVLSSTANVVFSIAVAVVSAVSLWAGPAYLN